MSDAVVKKRVVGVDISLEETTFAVVDVRGNIIAKESIPTEDYPEINGFVAALSEHIIGLVELNGGSQRQFSYRLYCQCCQYAVEGCHSPGGAVA